MLDVQLSFASHYLISFTQFLIWAFNSTGVPQKRDCDHVAKLALECLYTREMNQQWKSKYKALLIVIFNCLTCTLSCVFNIKRRKRLHLIMYNFNSSLLQIIHVDNSAVPDCTNDFCHLSCVASPGEECGVGCFSPEAVLEEQQWESLITSQFLSYSSSCMLSVQASMVL